MEVSAGHFEPLLPLILQWSPKEAGLEHPAPISGPCGCTQRCGPHRLQPAAAAPPALPGGLPRNSPQGGRKAAGQGRSQSICNRVYLDGGSTKGSSSCQGPSHSQQGARTDATQGTRPRHRAGTPLLGRTAPGRVQGLHTSQQCTWGPSQSGPGSPALAQGPHPLPAVLGCLTQVRLSLHSPGPQQSGFVSSYS